MIQELLQGWLSPVGAEIVSQIVDFSVVALLTWLVGRMRRIRAEVEEQRKAHEDDAIRRQAHDAAMERATKSLLRGSIVDACERAILRGWSPDIERRDIHQRVEDYFVLSGPNDLLGDYVEQVDALPLSPPVGVGGTD